MANQLDSFENNIKESLSQFEVDFNPDHWSEMNALLDKKKPSNKFPLGSIFSTTALLSLIALFINLNSDQSKTSCCLNNNVNEKPNNTTEVSTTYRSNNTNTAIKDIKTETQPVEQKVIPKAAEIICEYIEVTITEPSLITPVESKQNDYEDNNNNIEEKHNITSYESQKKKFNISKLKKEYCLNESIVLSTDVENDIIWELGDGTTTSLKSSQIKYDIPGTYTIKLIENNKELYSNTIIINPVPEVFFNIEEPSIDDINQEYRFIATNYGTTKTKWALNDNIATENTNEFLYSFYHKQNNTISLVGENKYGCISIHNESISINKNYNLLAPNAFSPNGDGIDDYWIPKALEFNNVKFEISIFDRKGDLVFKTNSANNQWDGTLRDGSIAKNGDTFIWIAEFTNHKGDKQKTKDAITVIY